MEGGKVCQPCALTAFTPLGNIPGTHFHYRLSQPQGYSTVGSVMSVKNHSDPISRNCDLMTCSTVSQPSAPLCTPNMSSVFGLFLPFISCW